MDYILQLKNVTKIFPGVRALSNVSMSVKEGEVHAIVGENGAGKSTLMKILGGVYYPDEGTILLKGKKIDLTSVVKSIRSGISIIYQEFNLMPELTVAENIFISKLPKIGHSNLLNLKILKSETTKLLKKLNIDIEPGKYVKDLTVSERQMVEIAKALSQNAEIIIMDEPTAALNNKEVERLYEIVSMLKAQNKTILYISHRLKEIFDIADRVTVLRDGKYIATRNIQDINQNDIVNMMVGRDIESYYRKSETQKGDVVLRVNSLTKNKVFSNITFNIRAGEIIGLAGLMGCGREEVAKAIYGLTKYDSGEIYIKGKKVQINSPIQAIKNGVAFVTEDRKEAGVFPEMTVKENLTLNILKRLCKLKGLYIDINKEREVLDYYTRFMNLKYSDEKQRIVHLSGGNQQKVVLARALATECEILILLEPTRGIDVGAKAEIYNLMYELASKGIAIIMVSSELPEIISICDRTLVMWRGQITGDLSKSEMDENNIMLCATGNKDYTARWCKA